MAQQLRELGNPNGINIWATKPQTPGALGNNAMAARPPVVIAAPPKFINSLMSAGQGLANAAMAPGNALMGNYQPTVDPNAPGGVDPYSGMIPDATNLAGLVTLGAGAAPADANALNMGIRAYHGSPHSFDQFDMSKIGTGEGAQAYGHGLYFAGNEGVAKGYRDTLAPRSPPAVNDASARYVISQYGGDVEAALKATEDISANGKPLLARTASAVLPTLRDWSANGVPEPKTPGSMYAVDINADPSQMLDWDKSLSEQPAPVAAALKKQFPQYFAPTVINKYTGLPVEFDKPMTADAISQYAKEMEFPVAVPAENMTVKTLIERHDFNPQRIAGQLKAAGISGIQYLGAGSRATGDGTKNYVVFDDKLINILKKYGIAGPIAGGATAAALQQRNQLTTPAAQPANPLIGQIGT